MILPVLWRHPYDARIAGFSYAEPRFKASGHWILRQDRGFSTRDEPLPSVFGIASRSPVPGKPAVRHRSRQRVAWI